MDNMAKPETFWIVWSPTGSHPPTYQHNSEQNAIAEACRLARLHHGHDFYVMKSTHLARKRDVDLIALETGDVFDGIPF